MVYATGGVGWINNEVRSTPRSVRSWSALTDSQMHVGGVIGAGVEHAFAPNWSVKVEYLYSLYGSETYFSTLGGGFSAGADTHTLKVGLNYHFR